MPQPKNRSNSVRKIKYRTPSGKSAIRFRRREKGAVHHCATCDSKLQATHSHSRLSPSSRTPNRKFGGMLCASCAKRVMIMQARIDAGSATMDSVEVRYLPYISRQKA